VPFTIYFESKFHQNPTILRQVPTSFCCLPPLSLVYTRPGASIGQYWRQTGTRLVPPWRQAGAMMAPGWHTTQTFAGRPQLQDLTDILQCIRFLLRAACGQTKTLTMLSLHNNPWSHGIINIYLTVLPWGSKLLPSIATNYNNIMEDDLNKR
jgi:hypothetical protein